MRLLTTTSLELVEFQAHEIPPYAILSHTWGKHEVTFEEVMNKTAQKNPTFVKVQSTAQQAAKDGFEYVWVDNCCIDKSSSAELSESLNSMYAWYEKAKVCYAYLADVKADIDVNDPDSEFARSRWFTRGFTLQELIAPQHVDFFSRDWVKIGSKIDLHKPLAAITGIEARYLCHEETIFTASIAKRMSWAAKRQTSRPEDIAYCLLGIFDISMPLLYGEGKKAFIRLQEEIMRQSDDHSIFAWLDDTESDKLYGLLAPSPRQFAHSQDIIPYESWEVLPPHTLTNQGLRIAIRLQQKPDERDIYIAALNCPMPPTMAEKSFLGIYLKKLSSGAEQYARVRPKTFIELIEPKGDPQTIFVQQAAHRVPSMHRALLPSHTIQLRKGPLPLNGYRVRETFPPSLANNKTFSQATTAPIPEFIQAANEEVRKWVRSSYRRSFQIHKAPQRLSGMILFQHGEGDNLLCVMLGSMGRFELGIDAIQVSAGYMAKMPENDAIESFQERFNPKPLGQGIVVDESLVSAAASDIRVHYGVKYYMLDLTVQHIEDTAPVGNGPRTKNPLLMDTMALAPYANGATGNNQIQTRGSKSQFRAKPVLSEPTQKRKTANRAPPKPRSNGNGGRGSWFSLAAAGLAGAAASADGGSADGGGGGDGGGC